MPAKGGARLSKGQDLFSCYKLPKTSFPKRKGPQEGHALQPHPVSQKCHLFHFKLVSQVTPTLPPAMESEHTDAPGEVSLRIQRQSTAVSQTTEYKLPPQGKRGLGSLNTTRPWALAQATCLIRGALRSRPIIGGQKLFKLYRAHHRWHPAACLLGGWFSSFTAPWFFACGSFPPIPCNWTAGSQTS